MNSSGGLPRYSSRRAGSHPPRRGWARGQAQRGEAGAAALALALRFSRSGPRHSPVISPFFSGVLIYHAHWEAPLRVESGSQRHPIAVDEPLDVQLDAEALRARSGTSACVGGPASGMQRAYRFALARRLRNHPGGTRRPFTHRPAGRAANAMGAGPQPRPSMARKAQAFGVRWHQHQVDRRDSRAPICPRTVRVGSSRDSLRGAHRPRAPARRPPRGAVPAGQLCTMAGGVDSSARWPFTGCSRPTLASTGWPGSMPSSPHAAARLSAPASRSTFERDAIRASAHPLRPHVIAPHGQLAHTYKHTQQHPWAVPRVAARR